MNEFNSIQENNTNKSWKKYIIFLAFGAGFLLGYQVPVYFFKEPVFVDLSQEPATEQNVTVIK